MEGGKKQSTDDTLNFNEELFQWVTLTVTQTYSHFKLQIH